MNLAGREDYIFRVDAQTEQAEKQLQDIEQIMSRIEKTKIRAQTENDTTSRKDMDKNMADMTKMAQQMKQIESDFRDMYATIGKAQDQLNKQEKPKIKSDSTKKEQQEALKQGKEQMEQRVKLSSRTDELISKQAQLNDMYKKAKDDMKEMSKFDQTPSKNFKSRSRSKDMYNLPREYKERQEPIKDREGNQVYRKNSVGKQEPMTRTVRELDTDRARKKAESLINKDDDVTSQVDDIRGLDKATRDLGKRGERRARSSTASGYMSHQQAADFKQDYETSQVQYPKMQEENLEKIVNLGQERTRVSGEIEHLETKEQTDGTLSEKDRMQRISYYESQEAIDREIEAREKLQKSLRDTEDSMKDYHQQIDDYSDDRGRGMEVKPERGSMKGMMYERAPAIGLAITGAIGAALGGLYSKGSSVNEGMRDDVISIGQRTDQENWSKSVKGEAFDLGLEDNMGFKGQEILDFQNAYLSNRGFEDPQDLDDAAKAQAGFSRATGLDSETTTDFFDSLYGSAVVDPDYANDVRDGFVGAIKQSGMEGREEEQLGALQDLIETTSQGITMDEKNIDTLMGMQSAFAQSDVESLRGEQGGELMSSLSEGIKGAGDDPMARLVMGMGTEFQGLEGRAELQRQMEEGLTPENLGNITDYAKAQGQGNEDIEALALSQMSKEVFGTDMTMEQAEGIMEMDRKGELDEGAIQKIMEEGAAEGGEISEEKIENYQEEGEATDKQSEAVGEKQASRLNDMGRAVRRVNAGLGGLSPITYAAITALGALATAAAGTAASFKTAETVRRAAGNQWGAGGTAARRNQDTRMGRNHGGGGGGGMFMPFGGGGKRRGETQPKGTSQQGDQNTRSGRNQGGGGGIFGKGKGNKGGGGGRGMPKMRGFGWMAALMALPEVVNLLGGDNTKEDTGGLFGNLGGMGAGAAIGSMIAPGIGTAIGSVVGSLVGDELGRTIGNQIESSNTGSALDWVTGVSNKEDDETYAEASRKSMNPFSDLNPKVIWSNTKELGENAEGFNDWLFGVTGKEDDETYTEASRKSANPLSRLHPEALKETITKDIEDTKNFFDKYGSDETDRENKEAKKQSNKEKIEEFNQDKEEGKGWFNKTVDWVTKPFKPMEASAAEAEDGDEDSDYSDVSKEQGALNMTPDYTKDLFRTQQPRLDEYEDEDKDLDLSTDAEKDMFKTQQPKDMVDKNKTKDQLNRENEGKKEGNERKREDNIRDERVNLDRYEALVIEYDRLLAQARQQNGLMGEADGEGSDGAGGGAGIGGSAGELKMLKDGKKWTNSDIKKHDLNYTDEKLSAEDLDAWIDSKAPEGSKMKGLGSAFFEAGQESGLDPRYLVGHAAHETGWGTSGINKDKNNWFGIGAFDDSPYASAYDWSDPEEGVVGGAKWIAENYYNKGDTDLSKMNERYATDPQWDQKIADIMKGSPTGTGTVNVDSNINVYDSTGGGAGKAAKMSKDLHSLGAQVNNAVFGAMDFHSKDNKRA